ATAVDTAGRKPSLGSDTQIVALAPPSEPPPPVVEPVVGDDGALWVEVSPEYVDALDEIDVVETVGSTKGTGSRTYDADPKPAPAPPPAPAPTVAPAPAPPLEKAPEPAQAPTARRPAPGEDLDWFDLIDKALPETTPAEGTDLSRVIIHLPSS